MSVLYNLSAENNFIIIISMLFIFSRLFLIECSYEYEEIHLFKPMFLVYISSYEYEEIHLFKLMFLVYISSSDQMHIHIFTINQKHSNLEEMFPNPNAMKFCHVYGRSSTSLFLFISFALNQNIHRRYILFSRLCLYYRL